MDEFVELKFCLQVLETLYYLSASRCNVYFKELKRHMKEVIIVT